MHTISQEKMIKALEWTLYLLLCLISIILAWKVFDQYSSEASSFTRSDRRIKSDPTIVICFEERQNLSYGVDFNISKYLSFEEYKNGPLMSHVLKEGESIVIKWYSYSRISRFD